jgi:hypothetical protein
MVEDIESEDGSDSKKRAEIVYRNVEEVLKTEELARGNDNWLLFKYWVRFDGLNIYFFYYDCVKNLTSAESITRARRKIQETGRYLPDDPLILIRRRVKAQVVRNMYADNPEKYAKWESLYNKLSFDEGIKRRKYPQRI